MLSGFSAGGATALEAAAGGLLRGLGSRGVRRAGGGSCSSYSRLTKQGPRVEL